MSTVNFTEEVQIKLLEWLNATETFVLEQAPDVAQQMLAWGMAYSHLQLTVGFVCLFFLVTAAVCLVVGVRWASNAPYDGEWKGACLSGFSTLVLVVTMIATPVTLWSGYSRLIKIDAAPKVYLIDQIARRNPVP